VYLRLDVTPRRVDEGNPASSSKQEVFLWPYITLTQAEADALIAMPKVRADATTYTYPVLVRGDHFAIDIADKPRKTPLGHQPQRIDLLKGTYAKPARHVIVLVRLDFRWLPASIPMEQEVPCPHLHVYREGLWR